MRSRRARTACIAAGLTAASLCAPPVVRALAPQCAVVATTAGRSWAAPLDRAVSLRARDVALREALDRLSASADVAFAFSPDLLALDRRVCLVADRQPLGGVLETLLAGSSVVPSVVAGRVVLVPRPAGTSADARVATRESVDVLERVVVTGSAIATARRPLTIGVEVVEGARLRQQSLGSLSELLDGGVPGAWMWAASPSNLLAQYGGIRGASSFGTSAPKIYLDGVEVANPLMITQLDPDALDHVEIIRGPQGSALYGSDAISGVINVVTRHDGRMDDGARLMFSSTAGASGSAFGPALIPTHEQRIALRLGNTLRSAGFAAQFGQSGAVFPSADTRQATLMADARAVTRSSIWTATARLYDRAAGPGQNPLLSGLGAPALDSGAGTSTATTTAGPDLTPQRARQYTVGLDVALSTAGPFTHSLLVGVDGYRLDHVAAAAGLYPVPADSAVRAMQGAGDRTTVRASSVGRFGGDGTPATTVTLGVEQSVLRLALPISVLGPTLPGLDYPVAQDVVAERWNHNTGVFAQVGASWHDAVFASAGLRMEQNDAFTGSDRRPLLPMLGVATVRDIGPASLKLRAAYGRGIRPPTVAARGTAAAQGMSTGTTPALDPESQAGTELGAELYLGSRASIQVTRFDQLASGLIQNVLVAVDSQIRGGQLQRHMRYELQNVGEIGNHGWEVQGTFTHRALSLATALTAVDSRVRTLARGYAGDLQSGDLMLGVPTRTASLSATWTAARWTGSVAASRAAHWVNYDRLALARDYAAAGPAARDLVGPRLRDYWTEYDGETHVRMTASRAMRTGLELLLVGDNLLGGQLGEPDNITIRPGRSFSAGVRAGF